MSPNEQKITSGRAAMASARSIISSGVTQTGQPGPWISSISSGSSWSMPLRMIEWVCPPQTSMSAHGRVAAALDLVSRRARERRVAELVEVLHDASALLARVRRRPTELLLEHAELVEQRERLERRGLVELGDGEAGVDDRVVADVDSSGT